MVQVTELSTNEEEEPSNRKDTAGTNYGASGSENSNYMKTSDVTPIAAAASAFTAWFAAKRKKKSE